MNTLYRIITIPLMVSFVVGFDISIVSPLVPDIAKSLGAKTDLAGILVGSFLIAAAVSSILLSHHIDKFGRKNVLCFSLLGLALSTLACAFSNSIENLVVGRIFCGVFGAPALSTAFSVVTERTSIDERAKAISMVMMGIPLATIFALPFSIEISYIYSWRWAFGMLALLIFAVALLAMSVLPPMTEHVSRDKVNGFRLADSFSKKEYILGIVIAGFMYAPLFLLAPHISTIIQHNYDFSRESLSTLYLSAGIVAAIAMPIAGMITRALGELNAFVLIGLIFTSNVAIWLLFGVVERPVLVYLIFMATNTTFMVPLYALTSRIPQPYEMAGYKSIQTTSQHIFSALAAFLSYKLVNSSIDGQLLNLENLAYSSIAALAALLVLVAMLATEMNDREINTISIEE